MRSSAVILVVLGLVLATVPATAAGLDAYLSADGRAAIEREGQAVAVRDALRRLEGSGIPQSLLQQVLASRENAPYLPLALPRLADLSNVTGAAELVKRFVGNGQGVAYELAVAHAHRTNLCSLAGFSGGQEVDGLLRSGAVLESKSAPPKHPEHLLEQIRRRTAGGQRMIVALNYVPEAAQLGAIRQLCNALGNRVEVQHIPLNGTGYTVLVPGINVEDPTARWLLPELRSVASPFAIRSALQPPGTSPRLDVRLPGRVQSLAATPKWPARPSWQAPGRRR